LPDEGIAQTYDHKVFGETKDNKKYPINTNREISNKSDLKLDSLPQSVDTLEVCDKAAARYAPPYLIIFYFNSIHIYDIIHIY